MGGVIGHDSRCSSILDDGRARSKSTYDRADYSRAKLDHDLIVPITTQDQPQMEQIASSSRENLKEYHTLLRSIYHTEIPAAVEVDLHRMNYTPVSSPTVAYLKLGGAARKLTMSLTVWISVLNST